MSYIAIWGNISTGDPIQLPRFRRLTDSYCVCGVGEKVPDSPLEGGAQVLRLVLSSPFQMSTRHNENSLRVSLALLGPISWMLLVHDLAIFA